MTFATFQFRRDTAANWTTANPVLLSGELALETDTAKFKIGNGTSAWTALAYGGIKGDTGAPGRGITTVTRTSGTGAPGTTDTYTITYSDSTTSTFTVYNGANGTNGTSPNAFTNIAVSGQSTVVADNTADTLTLVAGSGITLTTDAATDTITITGTVQVPQNTFANVQVGAATLAADLPADTLSVTAGTGITVSGDAATDTLTITNAAPDQTVSIASGTGISTTGTYPSFTVTNTAPARTSIGAPTLTNATAVTETVIARWAVPANYVNAGDAFHLKSAVQAGGTGTLIFRVRVGATGTVTDAVAITNTTSAAQAANAQVATDHLLYFTANGATGSVRGNGFVIAQAAVLGTPTAANTAVTVNTTAQFFVSLTVVQSVAATLTPLGAALMVDA